MNANIIDTKTFHERKHDLKVHQRSHKVTFMFKDQKFLRYLFCFMKTF